MEVLKQPAMREHNTKTKSYVWVKDSAGNEFLCPADALKDPKESTKEELESCIDVESLKPYVDL